MEVTREAFEALKRLPFFKGKVVSASMEPVIQTGEDIVVDVGARRIKRFDIVVVLIDGKLVCHYLWNMNRVFSPVLLQTRNVQGGKDYPVSLDDYLGKVISHQISFWRKLRMLL
ncbi:MAG TPA: S24/S26 family peptidase [Bacteriovoracaceae bacterium]|nr:S24/S26 family peptidase [Bacteriovoracaceae bacterium]